MIVPFRSQRLTRDANNCNTWETVTEGREIVWKRSGLIICDVWDRHWNAGAEKRLAPMLTQMDALARSLRKKGAVIVHAPSDCMDFYKDSVARTVMAGYAGHERPAYIEKPDQPSPLDASDGGNDVDAPPELVGKPVWTRQHPAIYIDDNIDSVSDDGDEIVSCFTKRGVENVFIMGVHTNMCVLNRSFGIKNMVRWGFNTALLRDLTDPMYNPAMPPYVNNKEALALIVGYVEKFWCPSVDSRDLIGG
jgi:nicotinamidase-related amidase